MRSFAFEDKTGIATKQRHRRLEYEPLAKREVTELARRYREEGDIEARNKIVLHFQKLLLGVASKKFKNLYRRMDMDELLNEGTIGLIRALETFDPKVSSFATYGAWWVRSFISEHFLGTQDTISLPATVLRQGFSQGLTRGMSFEDMVSSEDGEVHEDPLSRLGFFQEPEECSDQMPSLKTVLERSATLNEREKIILKLRGEGSILEEIGERLHVSKERVRQIEAGAIEKLKTEFGKTAELGYST